MDLLVGYDVYLGEENRVGEAVVVNEDFSEESAKSGRGKWIFGAGYLCVLIVSDYYYCVGRNSFFPDEKSSHRIRSTDEDYEEPSRGRKMWWRPLQIR